MVKGTKANLNIGRRDHFGPRFLEKIQGCNDIRNQWRQFKNQPPQEQKGNDVAVMAKRAPTKRNGKKRGRNEKKKNKKAKSKRGHGHEREAPQTGDASARTV